MTISLPLFNALRVSLVVLFLANGTAIAQSVDYYAPIPRIAKAYWDLKTDAGFHGTLVRFYAADSQLVYQESLPNQFIKLTPQNIRRLDQTLDKLVANQLIVNRIPISELAMVEPQRVTHTAEKSPARSGSAGADAQHELRFATQYLTTAGTPVIHLLLANPTRERLVISILSADQSVVYEHITHLEGSRHRLNFDGMAPGHYQIQVKSSTQQHRQPVTLIYGLQEAVVLINDLPPTQVSPQLISHK